MSNFLEITPDQDYVLNIAGESQFHLNQNQTYIMHESWINNITCKQKIAVLKQYQSSIDANNKRILFIRGMGMGDFLFLSPLIQFIKDRNPNAIIDFAAAKYQHTMLKLIPNINQIIELPILKKDFDNYDYHFTVTDIIETNSTNANVYDQYFNALGESNVDNSYKRPVIKNIKLNSQDKNIGIHPFANNPIRSMEMHLIKYLIDKLILEGYTPIVFSSNQEMELALPILNQKQIEWVINIGIDMETTAIVLATCSKVIAVDSVIVHLAQAMNIPTIAIYGPFPAETRVKYYTNISIIDSHPDCRCFSHNTQRCSKSMQGDAICLHIDPDLILKIIKNEDVSILTLLEPTIHRYNIAKANQ